MDDDDDDIIEEERSQQAAQFKWFNDLYIYDTGMTSLSGIKVYRFTVMVFHHFGKGKQLFLSHQ